MIRRLISRWVQERCLEACPYREIARNRMEEVLTRLLEKEDPRDMLEDLRQYRRENLHPMSDADESAAEDRQGLSTEGMIDELRSFRESSG